MPACDIGAVRLVRRIRCPTKHFSFCGVNRRVSKPRAGKAARAGKRRVCGFFQSSRSLRVRHETVPSVARAETGGDRRWEDGPPRSSAHHWRCSSPRACARLAGAGSCGSPYERCVRAIRPVRCRPNCSADDAFFAGQTVVVGSVRVRSARGVRVHTVHAAHERLWQGVRGVRRLLHRAIVPVG